MYYRDYLLHGCSRQPSIDKAQACCSDTKILLAFVRNGTSLVPFYRVTSHSLLSRCLARSSFPQPLHLGALYVHHVMKIIPGLFLQTVYYSTRDMATLTNVYAVPMAKVPFWQHHTVPRQ